MGSTLLFLARSLIFSLSTKDSSDCFWVKSFVAGFGASKRVALLAVSCVEVLFELPSDGDGRLSSGF